jgi:ankyrin repeat protein
MQLQKEKAKAPLKKKAMRLLELSKRSAKRMLMSKRMRMGMDNALIEAVKYDNSNKTKRLIKAGASITAKHEDGWSPLHFAASRGNTDICKLLMEEYAKAGGSTRKLINAKNNAGKTPLHYAATNIDTRTCELLLENGAEITARDKFGDTPLDMAILSGRVLPMEFLAPKLLEATIGNEAFALFTKSFSDCLAA